jgi:hypothetical protein
LKVDVTRTVCEGEADASTVFSKKIRARVFEMPLEQGRVDAGIGRRRSLRCDRQLENRVQARTIALLLTAGVLTGQVRADEKGRQAILTKEEERLLRKKVYDEGPSTGFPSTANSGDHSVGGTTLVTLWSRRDPFVRWAAPNTPFLEPVV